MKLYRNFKAQSAYYWTVLCMVMQVGFRGWVVPAVAQLRV